VEQENQLFKGEPVGLCGVVFVYASEADSRSAGRDDQFSMSATRKLPATRHHDPNQFPQSPTAPTRNVLFPLPFLTQDSRRLFSQGSSLRFDERKTRGLDSAWGKAPGTATKGSCFFFSNGITLKKRKKEGTKCQKDNMRLGENYCGRRSKSRGECSRPTLPFIITASYVEGDIE